jgi:hypothetical protein
MTLFSRQPTALIRLRRQRDSHKVIHHRDIANQSHGYRQCVCVIGRGCVCLRAVVKG